MITGTETLPFDNGNPRPFGSRCIKGTEESTLEVDSSVPLTHRDLRYLGLICLVKKRKIHFQVLSDLRIQSWIFLKKRTLRVFLLSPGWHGMLVHRRVNPSIKFTSTHLGPVYMEGECPG